MVEKFPPGAKAQKMHRFGTAEAVPWSFYIFSSGGGAHELGIGDFDFEFLQKLGVLGHLLA